METIKPKPFSFFEELLKNVSAVIYIFDLTAFKYIWTNGKYFDILGYDCDEVKINAIEYADKHYHPDDKALMKEKVDFFKKNNGSVWSGVYRIKHKQGHWVLVLSKISVLKRDNNGCPEQLVGLATDVSNPLMNEKQFEALFKERLRVRNQELIIKLTKREIDILRLIAKGNSYTKIAEMLSIQPDTVNRHRKNILKKLNLKNIATLACFAAENGLV
ncbi:MAG: PAS domain-containing protein [Bacteroidetes bacterium]|nr:PAS domain-containing protein [Bacteroidota bacterium]MBL7102898.1 PAS domain-containing protein [Bacteroidales bacterium]